DSEGSTGRVRVGASDVRHVVGADVVPHLDAADVSVVVQNSSDVAIDNVAIIVEVLPAEVTEANLLDPDPLNLIPPQRQPVAMFTVDKLSVAAHGVMQRGASFEFHDAEHLNLATAALYVLVELVASAEQLRGHYE